MIKVILDDNGVQEDIFILSDIDEKTMQDSLLGRKGIKVWVLGALVGKLNNCRKRLTNQWIPKLIADPKVTNIPADVDNLVLVIRKREDYKTREERDLIGQIQLLTEHKLSDEAEALQTQLDALIAARLAE